jgi:hypothetical protein
VSSNVGVLSSAQSSTVGIWCEATLNQNIALSANTATTVTFVAPATGSGSFFSSNTYQLPIAVTLLSNTNYNSPAPNIQQSNINFLNTTNVAISSVFQNSSGINVTFYGMGSANNVNTNSRLLFVFNNGI